MSRMTFSDYEYSKRKRPKEKNFLMGRICKAILSK